MSTAPGSPAGGSPVGGSPAGGDRRVRRAVLHIDIETPVYVISVAAELSGMHPQTLRQYDRLGLVTPGRAGGGARRYSARDVEQLREVQRLSQDHGVNLAGVKRILELENEVDALRSRATELAVELERAHATLAAVEAQYASGVYRRTYLPAVVDSQGTAVVHWGPRRG